MKNAQTMKSQELANGEKSCNGKKEVEEASPMERKVTAGDIIWVKNRGGLWWPAQVVESIKANKKSARKVLARQYGTYTYSYVDPNKWVSEFETVLKQNNGSYREIFAKSLERDVARLNNGGSKKQKSKPEGNKEDKSQKSKKSTAETKSKPNGKHAKEDASKKKVKRKTRESTEEGSVNLTPKPSEALQRRKFNDSSPEKMLCSQTQELSARRIRVMQSLGLAAPTGSPFTRNGRIHCQV